MPRCAYTRLDPEGWLSTRRTIPRLVSGSNSSARTFESVVHRSSRGAESTVKGKVPSFPAPSKFANAVPEGGRATCVEVGAGSVGVAGWVAVTVWVTAGTNVCAGAEDNFGVRVGVGETRGECVVVAVGDRSSLASSGSRFADASVAVRKVFCPSAATSEVADRARSEQAGYPKGVDTWLASAPREIDM